MQNNTAERIADVFRQKIVTGQWPVGSRLPTTRQLSVEYQVSVNTIQGAFRRLQADDLVERRPRRGGFVKSGRAVERTVNTATGTTVAILAEAVSREEPREGHNWCYSIARGAERELSRSDYHVSLISWAIDDPQAAGRMRSRIGEIEDRLAGVICFPMPNVQETVDQLRRRGIPCVTINRPGPHAVEDFVTAANQEGGRLVGRCFGRLGLDSVVILGEPFVLGNTTADKYSGFLQGYIESGMAARNVDFVACRSFHAADGYEQFKTHCDRFGPPRGVFTTGDFLAVGALRLCRERGWSVPDQVAIVGGTGLDVASYTYPSLSVCEQPMDAMGTAAAEMLMEMIRTGRQHLPGRFVPGRVVLRQSLRMPRALADELGVTVEHDVSED